MTRRIMAAFVVAGLVMLALYMASPQRHPCSLEAEVLLRSTTNCW